MLDLFSIFSKGGIVLWCCQATNQSLTSSVNALIKSVILQERGGLESFSHEALTLKYQLDNEFDLVFVIGYQKFLQLSYVDKFLTDIQREFRDRYKNDLEQRNVCRNFTDFDSIYQSMLKEAEESSKQEAKAPRSMKSFQESDKSKKTVASMIERKDDKAAKGSKNKNKAAAEKVCKQTSQPVTNQAKDSPKGVKSSMDLGRSNGRVEEEASMNGGLDEETLRANRERLFQSKTNKTNKSSSSNNNVTKSPSAEGGDSETKKKGKENRQWELSGKRNDVELNYSKDKGSEDVVAPINEEQQGWVGRSKGQIPNLEPEDSSSEEEEEERPVKTKGGASGGRNSNKTSAATPATAGSAGKSRFGFLSGLTNLVGSKTLTAADIEPVLDKMKHHLIGKNVASEIAENLCKSIATKLEGKVLGTFSTVAATVKEALNESCIQLLEPKKRVDILRDAMDAKQRKVPYTIAFCGVNGVGKSTNLAKVCFWLIENGLRVLIAACDTFRAGAVEQLRTHCRKLNTLHPPEMHGGVTMVQLYEKGYGKDAAGIAMEAIRFARDQRIDVVLVDTAGRMQDNEPLMRALAKLIKVNDPDLVLFVGEALVGNEAVDQLVKFNQALADHSSKEKPHLIDGIVLTKFDTIDDKVGAAISMTYITGQPIMFVGTGQTYVDLKNLNARSVVHSLLKA